MSDDDYRLRAELDTERKLLVAAAAEVERLREAYRIEQETHRRTAGERERLRAELVCITEYTNERDIAGAVPATETEEDMRNIARNALAEPRRRHDP